MPDTRFLFRCVVATGLLVFALPVSAQRPTPTSHLSARQCDSLPAGARCLTLSVPEDHARRDGRRLRVAIAVIPARTPAPDSTPLLVLLGGPGDAASFRYAQLARSFSALNETRDLVFVDQRGTGQSAPLNCGLGGHDGDLQSYLDAFAPPDAAARCRRKRGDSVDLTKYRTADFIADLELVRQALGIARWNLHGVSYGTRAALQYLARHPERIRSAVLIDVVPPQLVMPGPFARDMERSLRMVIADCQADAQCRDAFPRLREEIDSVAARLDAAPRATTVRHPVTGAVTPVLFSRFAFSEVIRAALYAPFAVRTLPLEIREAFQGDYSALADAHLQRQRTVARQEWIGMYLAVTCIEDVARLDTAEALAEARRFTLRDFRVRQHVAACRGWPRPTSNDTWPATSRIDPPVLMIAGDHDPVTPPEWARLAQRSMSRAKLIVVPHAGHSIAGLINADCVARLQEAFLEKPDPAQLDAACVATIRRPPFVIAR